jgi:excisionase family DNA binding protein
MMLADAMEAERAARGMWTIGEAAQALGVSLSTIRRSDLPVYKIGKARRYKPSDIAEFLARARKMT